MEEEEDGAAAAAAEPQRLGRTEAGREGSRPRSVCRRRRAGGVARGEGVGVFREACGGEESRGAEDGGRRGSGGRVG
jgi:hypothetical protein